MGRNRHILKQQNGVLRHEINDFIGRVAVDGGTSEATDKCLYNTLVDIPSSLREQAKLLITPNAYKSGTLYAALPGANGDELTTNGSFDSDTWWAKQAGWTISGGEAHLDGTNPSTYAVYRNIGVVEGASYEVTFTITSITTGEFKAGVGNTLGVSRTTTGTYTDTIVAGSSGNIGIYGTSGTIGSIDDVSVKATGDLTWTRATTATRVNSGLDIESVGSGVPRIDYPIDGSCPYILLEPQRTNLYLYSEAFDNAAWNKTRATIDANDITSPDGTVNAAKLTATDTSLQGYVFEGVTLTTATDYNISVFVKAGTHVGDIYISDFSDSGSVIFNLTTLVVSSSGIVSNEGYEDYGNGWYRVYGTFTTTIATGNHNIVYGYFNNGTGDATIYIYGAQCEAGSYPTSYIPTSGSTVTRNADLGTGAGTSAEFNSEEGVLFVEMAALFDTGAVRYLSISDGTNDNRITLGFTNDTNTIGVLTYVGGAVQGVCAYVVTDTTDFHKVACRWKVNDFSLWIDGVEVATDVSGSVPAANTFTSFQLDQGAGANDFQGKIKQVATFDYLDDTQMENLTT